MPLEFNIIYCHHEHDEGEPCNDDCRHSAKCKTPGRAMTLATDCRVIAPRGHLWKVLPDTGELDWFAYDYDPHSGLLCLLCYESACRSCRDDINEECDVNQLETLPGMEY